MYISINKVKQARERVKKGPTTARWTALLFIDVDG